MAALYPESLPSPLAKSISARRQDTKRRIEFDAKNSRTTNHASNAPTIIDCQFVLDGVQLDAFDYFYKFTANFGANWIDAPWLSALGFNSHYFRFLQKKESKDNGVFLITATLEIADISVHISPATVIWMSSNIQPQSFPPAGDLDFWYKADEDAHASGFLFTSDQNLPNFGSGALTLKVDQGAYAGSLTYGAGITTVGGFKALSVVANYNGYFGYVKSLVPVSSHLRSFIFVSDSNFDINSGFFRVLKNGGRIDVSAVKATNYNSEFVALYPAFSSTGRDAFVFNFTATGADFYLNGVKLHTFIGSRAINAGYLFYDSYTNRQPTRLYELLIYGRPLTEEEVVATSSALTLKWQIE